MGKPILSLNLRFRYGYWTGSGYSAGVDSPSFVPFTIAQQAVPGYDAFDQVSKNHDINDANAQNALISDLASGVDRRTALITYYKAIAQLDGTFVAGAQSATANVDWGNDLKTIGIAVLRRARVGCSALG
jgi:hypothetical protein